MKITNVDLTFRSYRETSINTDAPRVLIAGRNGSGKTSIREAIRWALLGFCEGTDGKGAGAEVLVPVGTEEAAVSVAIADVCTLTRRFGRMGGGLTVTGFTGSSQVQQQALLAKLNTTPAFLNAVLDTSVFLNLSHGDAKALILSLLGVKITVMGETHTLDSLDAIHKQAFENRRVAKKVLAQFVVPARPQATTMPTIEAINGQLTKLRTALGERQKAVGASAGKRYAMEIEHKKLKAIVDLAVPEDLSEKLANLETMLAGLEATVTPEPEKTDPQYMMFLRKTVAELQRHEPAKGCIIDKAIPCNTARKLFGDRLSDINVELKAMDPRPTTTENPLTTVRRQIDEARQRQNGRLELIRQQGLADGRMQEIEVELGAAGPADDPEIAKLEERIRKGEQLLSDARTFWTAVEANEAAMKKQAALKAEVDQLEELVYQTGPLGARVQALDLAMGNFLAQVNPYLQPFGWTVKVSVEPWQVFANDRPVETYSKSERYRIGIALQMAIAMLSGLKFAVIDEMDMLDVENRGIVTKMLLAAPLEQILILGTREPSQKLPAVKGVIAHRLESVNGTTKVAESVAA